MKKLLPSVYFVLAVLLLYAPEMRAIPAYLQETQEFIEYKGRVINSETGDPIAAAQLSVSNTNIATVTNAEGEFSLKIPGNLEEAVVRVTYLGYQSKNIAIGYFSQDNTEIELEPSIEELEQVSIYDATDAGKLVREMLSKRADNYLDQPTEMTAFYRESIRKGRRNASLSEAVLRIHKEPYSSGRRDDVELVKARKTADYDRLDTLALKLRGGPYNALFIDVMKYPEYIFADFETENYEFTFEEPTQLDGRYLYVVYFEDRNKDLPWYYGQFFIDAETSALVRANFKLNVDNRRVATRMFVSRKPGSTRVHPIDVHYEIDYQQQDGKWFYGYGSAKLEFVVNWKRKLFNSRYHVHSEMAVTGWERQSFEGNPRRSENYLKPNVVMTDDISGFSDPEFWGSNNIIEPDKSIENAIDKIRSQLD